MRAIWNKSHISNGQFVWALSVLLNKSVLVNYVIWLLLSICRYTVKYFTLLYFSILCLLIITILCYTLQTCYIRVNSHILC